MSSYDSVIPDMVLEDAKAEKYYRILRSVRSLLKRGHDPSKSLAVLISRALDSVGGCGFTCEVSGDTIAVTSDEGVKFDVTISNAEYCEIAQ